MDTREKRLVANEVVARQLNESADFERPRRGAGNLFVCECSRAGCDAILEIALDDYMRVRSNPRRFVVRQGHDNPAIESIIVEYPGYAVVQKRGEAGRIAEAEPSTV